jgi:hypothetical protein
MRLDADQAYIPWALPLEGGPVRTLFIAPHHTMRDADGLAQRIETELVTVSLPSSASLGTEDEQAAVMKQLDQGLKGRVDVIITANINAAVLPDSLWQTIADRVRGGCGLILANMDMADAPALDQFLDESVPAEDLRALTHGIGEQITPEWTSGLDFLDASTVGEGRIVVLDYGPERPRTHALLPPLIDPLLAFPEFLDTYFALMTKSVRWAAGRDPLLFVEHLLPAGPAGPREEEIPPQLPPEYIQRMRDAAIPGLLHPYALRFSQPADRDYDIRIQTRRLGRSHEEVFTQALVLAKGSTDLSLDLYGGAGQYLVDIWIATRKGIMEWHTELVTLHGWPEFDALRFSKDYILPNDAIDISFDVRPHFAQPRSCSFHARALDRHGRLVAEVTQGIPEGGGKTVVTLPFADVLTPLVRVEAYLVDSAPRPFAQWELHAAAFEYLYVAVIQPAGVQMPELAVLTPAAYEYNSQYFLKRLRDAGATSAYIPFADGLSWPAAAAGFNTITEAAYYAPEFVQDAHVPCLSDPGFRDAESTRLQQVARLTGGSGMPLISLGLANGFPESEGRICQSPHCLDRFRQWIQIQYVTLDALNDAWGTVFATWDAVVPLDRKSALEQGRLAAALDLLRFEEEVFLEFHVFTQAAVTATSPQARVGFQPLDQRNVDWRRIATSHSMILAAPNSLAECAIQSWRSKEAWPALCWQEPGLQRDPRRLAWIAWHSLLHQIPGTAYLPAYGTADSAGDAFLLTPGGDPVPEFQPLFDTIRRLREDIGPLILAAERASARVAIFDSTLCRLYAEVDASIPAGYRESQNAWLGIFHGLGYKVELISPEEILAGGLDKFQALVLPQARALESTVADRIAPWNEAGGILIADVAPRIYTPKGLRPSTLFAAETRGPGSPAGVTNAHVRIETDKGKVDSLFPALLADSHIAAGAMAPGGEAEGVPLWLQDSPETGGRRLLLNHALTAATDVQEAAMPLMAFWLEAAGVTPDLPLYRSPKKRFHGEASRFRYGAADLYVFLRDCDGAGSEKAEVELDKGFSVYDLVNHLAPPRPRKVSVKLGAGEAGVVAVLPYRVSSLAMTAPEQIAQGQRLEYALYLDTGDEEAGQHLIQVSLIPSLRPPLEHYRQFITCRKGAGRGYIPLALNESPGRYTLRATDLLSGQTAESVIDIQLRQLPVSLGTGTK